MDGLLHGTRDVKEHSRRILLAIILTCGGVARVYRLDQIPPGLHFDEAVNGLLGLRAARSGNFRVVYTQTPERGREGLWINIVGESARFLGPSVFALRLPAAMVGTLTLVFLYLLGRLLFGTAAALAATWFTAASFWHVALSRTSFRAILVPLFLTASIYLLLRAGCGGAAGGLHAARNPSRASPSPGEWACAAAGGLLFGLGFYSYIAFRIAPVLAAAVILIEAAQRKGFPEALRRWWALAAVWLGVAFATALPIGIFYLGHPAAFFNRTVEVGIFGGGNAGWDFVTSLISTSLMFNLRGDCNWAHNIACQPELILPVGLFFLLGLALAVLAIARRSLKAQAECITVVWFLIFLLPEVLSREGIPHAIRAIGSIPAVYLFAGLGAAWTLEKLRGSRAAAVCVLAVLVFAGIANGWRYFVVWGRNPQVAFDFGRRNVALEQSLKQFPPSTPVELATNDWGCYTAEFLLGDDSKLHCVTPAEALSLNPAPGTVVAVGDGAPEVIRGLARRGFDLEITAADGGQVARVLSAPASFHFPAK